MCTLSPQFWKVRDISLDYFLSSTCDFNIFYIRNIGCFELCCWASEASPTLGCSFPIRYFSMDEKEAEACPVMGTIFLVIIPVAVHSLILVVYIHFFRCEIFVETLS